MRAVIVDDERLARREMRRLLRPFAAIEVVGEAADGEAARRTVCELQPDLLFLDIRMPGADGFELLESLDRVPHVIFTTAYDEYAIKAFEVSALDYLLKPIEHDRLAASIDRLFATVKPRSAAPIAAGASQLRATDQVFVKDGDQCWFVRLGDVSRFESDGNYTILHLRHAAPRVHRTLNYLESRLDPTAFFRANRSLIVNMRCVAQVHEWFNGQLRMRLADHSEVTVSRRRAQRFRELKSL